MDEPTVGIDVQAKVRILEVIERAGKDGTAVVFTTHQLAEVEQICSRIGIMDKGKIIASGTLEELKKIVGEKDIVEIRGEFETDILGKMLKTGPDYDLISAEEDLVTLAFENRKKLPGVLEKFFKKGIGISEIKIKSPNLESVFLKLTGRSLRD